VATSPAELARQAGLVVGVYTVARNVRSEEGRSAVAHRLAVAEMARNKALKVGYSVTRLLTERTSKDYRFTRGHYGRQRGHWAATTLDPRECDVVTAHIALYERSRLLPTTADKYYDPRASDGGSGGKRWTDRVLDKWTGEGNEWIGPVVYDGQELLDPYGLMVFHKVKDPDPTAAREAIQRGRDGFKPSEQPRRGGGGALLCLLGLVVLS